MGEMRRAIAREEEDRRKQDRFTSTLVIAASIIAAVRLARDDISRPSPRVQSVIVDSQLAVRLSILSVLSLRSTVYKRESSEHSPTLAEDHQHTYLVLRNT